MHVTINITNQMIADQVTVAFEGGSNYWIDGVKYLKSKDGFEPPAYSDPAFYEQPADKLFKIGEDDEDETLWRVLSISNIQKGFQLLSEHYPKRLERILTGRADAEDADVWLQLALFGEVVYG